MSWWTDIRDTGESIVSDITPFDVRGESARKRTGGIGGFANKVRNYQEGIFNKVLGRPSQDELRNQRYAVADQIKAYQDQTNLEKQQLDEARNSQDVEKRRVQEKQIRSLRRNYRGGAAAAPATTSSSLLGQGQPVATDVNTKLGG
jgi:hypothetical protein